MIRFALVCVTLYEAARRRGADGLGVITAQGEKKTMRDGRRRGSGGEVWKSNG